MSVALGRERPDSAALEELSALAVSAGYEITERIQVRRERADAGLFVGSGKA
ncbi:MAG: GTPase HflX, partial [Actinobacteria bacterium]|nr:GTPase HflX [Actinomycetota bacterium]